MRYLLYARKSSESEDRQVQSIDDQLEALRHLARRQALDVLEEITESKSAKAPGQRPAFARMLSRIQAGHADAVLCWSVNRLSRNPVDSGTLQWMLQEGTLRAIQTVDREYKPEDNVVLMAVESGVANQFILDLKKAVARGMQSKRERGWYPHHAPQGYLNDPKDRTIVPDGKRFLLLRRAWEMMLTGAYTVPQVRTELTAWGFITRKAKKQGGKPISRTALYDLFGNPFYHGAFYHAGRSYQGLHKPMVTKGEWDRVQAMLGKAQHIQPQKREFAFTGLIRCGRCGCLVTAEERVKHYKTTGRTARYRYYHCSGAKGCPKQSVSEEYLEQQIAGCLQQCRLSTELTEWLLDVTARSTREQGEPDMAVAQAQARALSDLKRRRDGLVDMRACGEISREEFAERRASVDGEMAALEEAQSCQADKAARDKETLSRVVGFAGSAYERFMQGDLRAKREVAVALGGEYVLTLGCLKIQPHPLLDVIRTFEPMKTEFGSRKQGGSVPFNPTWCSMLDDIRTLLRENELSFTG